MPRNILLVEPDYKTKFPPLGLMKLSTYHKTLGDNVQFVKGWNHDVMYTFWDRIYITTLFSYHWNTTVNTIKFYKELVQGDISRVFVGGIMSSLMTRELWDATGIIPVRGVLYSSKILGDRNRYIIDNMIPDYSLFEGTQSKYELLDSYLLYSTRGCPNKCPFCGVHILEPKFIDYKDIKPYVKKIEEAHGKKQHLVLLDNNILASEKFRQIIRDIRDLGFGKNAKHENRLRFVDFNQGVDVRLINERHFELLKDIAINPLRIAFDDIKLEKIYKEKIRLAAKHGIKKLSNYILYNYRDHPRDFWKRLKINIDLNQKYGLTIYSFPMKYIPIDAKDRKFIDEPKWNWQFIRSVQRILNVVKGSVMPGKEFFERAFGKTEREFLTILHMPESILMFRGREPKQEEKDWEEKFNNLTENEKKELLALLCQNKSKHKLAMAISRLKNQKLIDILDYYLPDYTLPPLPLFEEK